MLTRKHVRDVALGMRSMHQASCLACIESIASACESFRSLAAVLNLAAVLFHPQYLVTHGPAACIQEDQEEILKT
jgi:hypothetical protein